MTTAQGVLQNSIPCAVVIKTASSRSGRQWEYSPTGASPRTTSHLIPGPSPTSPPAPLLKERGEDWGRMGLSEVEICTSAEA